VEGRGEEGEGKRRRGEGRGGEALAVEPSHFSTGSDATAHHTVTLDLVILHCVVSQVEIDVMFRLTSW